MASTKVYRLRFDEIVELCNLPAFCVHMSKYSYPDLEALSSDPVA
jgi:hypothetical protein